MVAATLIISVINYTNTKKWEDATPKTWCKALKGEISICGVDCNKYNLNKFKRKFKIVSIKDYAKEV